MQEILLRLRATKFALILQSSLLAPSMTPLEALEAAIRVCGGTPTTLASAIGTDVVRQNVEHWLRHARDHGRPVPAEHCPAIERATRERGEPVLCEWLNPTVSWDVLRGFRVAKAAA